MGRLNDCTVCMYILHDIIVQYHMLIYTHTPAMVDPSDEGDFLQAIDRYTEAITLNRNNHLLFSNRSAAYSRVGKFSEALDDAKRCHELKHDWPKVRA